MLEQASGKINKGRVIWLQETILRSAVSRY